ncbi:hypothetical protein Skr01_32890 [Sphaerisporangium krabiense]|nr:hypothetical protein Skr01_32890 [Sphaerisporangium krabiense]
MQVWHEDGGDYVLEHRDGAPDRHSQAILDRPDSVISAMTRWARLDDGWGSGLDWTPLDLDIPEPLSLSNLTRTNAKSLMRASVKRSRVVTRRGHN